MIPGVKVLSFMNNAEKNHEWIDRFNDNELEGDELKEFLELMKNDPVFRAEVRLDKELNEILQEEDILELRKKIKEVRNDRENRGLSKRSILFAASIMIILVLSVFLYLVISVKTRNDMNLQGKNSSAKGFDITRDASSSLNDGKNIPVKPTARNDTHTTKGPVTSNNQNQLLIASYKPFPPFESLIGTHVRSDNFKMTGPSPGARFKSTAPILFSWETDKPLTLTLEIMDNKGTLVFDLHGISDKSIKIPYGKLKDGLFYFKILKEDEIVFFGKFTVEIN
jgi:hypothetical protein